LSVIWWWCWWWWQCWYKWHSSQNRAFHIVLQFLKHR
jgi:hypothetical protein